MGLNRNPPMIIKAPYIHSIGSDCWLIILETRTNKGLFDIEYFLDEHPLIENYAIYSEDIIDFIKLLPLELRTDLSSYRPLGEPYSFEEYVQITIEELKKELNEAETSLKKVEINLKDAEVELIKLEEVGESKQQDEQIRKT